MLFVLPSVLRERHWHDRLRAAYGGPNAGRQRLIELPYIDPDHDKHWHLRDNATDR